MYRQWCKNLKNFINYNMTDQPCIRLQLAKELLPLTDIEAYKKHKQDKSPIYWKTAAFINQLKQFQDQYSSIKKFIWELWGYGFDITEEIDIKMDDTEVIEETVKLIDLLYGTHYM